MLLTLSLSILVHAVTMYASANTYSVYCYTYSVHHQHEQSYELLVVSYYEVVSPDDLTCIVALSCCYVLLHQSISSCRESVTTPTT